MSENKYDSSKKTVKNKLRKKTRLNHQKPKNRAIKKACTREDNVSDEAIGNND